MTDPAAAPPSLMDELEKLAEWLENPREPVADRTNCHRTAATIRGIIAAHQSPTEAELQAQLQWVGEAIAGRDVSEFAKSFPLVRAVADLKAAAETREPSQHPQKEGCVNCGATDAGGYMTGFEGHPDEGAVGPFCRECWDLLGEFFEARAASSPPDAVA